MATPVGPKSPKDTSQTLTYPAEKEKNVEMGDSDAATCDVHEAIQSTPPNTSKDGEKATPPTDPFDVWWDEPADQDPENPMNWSMSRKWASIAVLSSITFLTPLASSMFAPGIPKVMVEFHTTSPILATFVVSVFVLGFAFGPLFLAPLSEMYGRIPIYHTCNILFIIFTIGCAVSKSMGMLIAFRFLAGVAGVATVTCGSGTIADLMPVDKRGLAMSLWSLGPLMGPIIGPIIGGFLISAAGWRWVFWLVTIASGLVTILAFFVFHETYPVVLLERKAARLRKETGNPNYKSRLASKLTRGQVWQHTLERPMKMLFMSPIVAAMCVYIAVMYGLLYILFTTYTFVFEDVYHFSTSTAGLAFLGSGVGTLSGLAFVATQSDRIIKAREALGPLKPEDRLPLLITLPACFSIPSGLIIYGWATDKAVHWIVPQIGTAIIGFGMIAILMCIQTYLVDAFTIYAASAIAANTVLRSVLGALLPLCGLDMYNVMGLGWGNTLLGLIAFALAPIPWVFAVYGERIRNSRWGKVSFS